MTNALFSFPDENHKRQFKKLSPTSRNQIVERISLLTLLLTAQPQALAFASGWRLRLDRKTER